MSAGGAPSALPSTRAWAHASLSLEEVNKSSVKGKIVDPLKLGAETEFKMKLVKSPNLRPCPALSLWRRCVSEPRHF